MLTLKSKTTLASAAALLALSGASFATPAAAANQQFAAKVMCFGVNACKGQSDCKSGNHACKGQNSCKGQGFKDLSAKACAAQHGSTTAPQG
ncbi:MAG TPA: hypothetical protein VH353_06295 [Caulobacteraceae bacterium]|jgi:uncharacterized membrane protein|nr:hypothetical protein [Caulobacteraceae bacterium]